MSICYRPSGLGGRETKMPWDSWGIRNLRWILHRKLLHKGHWQMCGIRKVFLTKRRKKKKKEVILNCCFLWGLELTTDDRTDFTPLKFSIMKWNQTKLPGQALVCQIKHWTDVGPMNWKWYLVFSRLARSVFCFCQKKKKKEKKSTSKPHKF